MPPPRASSMRKFVDRVQDPGAVFPAGCIDSRGFPRIEIPFAYGITSANGISVGESCGSESRVRPRFE